MTKVVFLGAGAAPGVPSLSCGWGNCNPANPKNIRRRTSTYYEFGDTAILIDTSPDLRVQLLDNQIRRLDGVLYTHTHADHLHGIDDLREINRISRKSLNIYAVRETMKPLKKRFDYLIYNPLKSCDVVRQPSLISHIVKHNKRFKINEVEITPLKLLGHNAPTTGYAFNGGEIVHLADFRSLAGSAYKQISCRPKLLVVPLTTPYGQKFHAGLEEVLETIDKINPHRVIINHMASECDYDAVNAATPDFVTPAHDNLVIEL